MSPFSEAFRTIAQGEALSFEQAKSLMVSIADQAVDEVQIASMLAAIEVRGYRASEIAGFASALAERLIPIPQVPDGTLDTCGTGGAPFPTLNVSTMTALVVAASGVSVAKHGNRSASGRAGSLDVLEALGARIDVSPEASSDILQDVRFCFVNARLHHPVLGKLGSLRKRLGYRTVFNLLGPLVSPARVQRQLIGVSHPTAGPIIAEAVLQLGHRMAWVVYGPGGIDELSVSGPTQVWQVKGGKVEAFEVHPEHADLAPADMIHLQGDDPAYNARRMRAILGGERSPAADQVALNAGAALLVSGTVENLKEGVRRAQQTLGDASALRLLERYIEATKGKKTL